MISLFDLARWARKPARILGCVPLAVLLGGALPVEPLERAECVLEEVEWIVQPEDSICGVREARQITKPAVIRFDYLVGVTPEGKKVKRERIDPNSPEGIRLLNLAKSKVRDGSSVVMKRQGFDSVWKVISSRKGTHVEDVTEYVEIEITRSLQLGGLSAP